jgi:hypothetical protein
MSARYSTHSSFTIQSEVGRLSLADWSRSEHIKRRLSIALGGKGNEYVPWQICREEGSKTLMIQKKEMRNRAAGGVGKETPPGKGLGTERESAKSYLRIVQAYDPEEPP